MLNPLQTCPDCDGKGLISGSICTTCGGDGTVRAKRAATPPTSTATAAAGVRAGFPSAPERNENAERLVRTLLETGVSSQSMLDALQLLALAGAASAGVVTDSDDVVLGLAERVAASARERLGLAAAAEHETKRKRKS